MLFLFNSIFHVEVYNLIYKLGSVLIQLHLFRAQKGKIVIWDIAIFHTALSFKKDCSNNLL